MREMTIDRAVNNAIASVEMEGYTITAEERDLIYRLVRKEITLKEALELLNKKQSA